MMNQVLRERFINYLYDLKSFYSGEVIRMEYQTKNPSRDSDISKLKLKIDRVNDDIDLLRASLEDA